MLETLTIRNYAIIEEMSAEFPDGLTVITGETGAGKSIVVDALELVLGARASVDMIRAGAFSLEVSGVFGIKKPLIEELLPFDIDEEILILRREVRSDGNNRCYANDRPITLRVLKELGNRLVDFHGQHDHQSLLNVQEHIMFLDGYGELNSLVHVIGQLYDEMLTIRNSVEKLEHTISSAIRDRELFTFQFNEINEAKIIPGEDRELETSIRKLSRAEELKTLSMEIFQELTEEEMSISERLGKLYSSVEEMSKYDSELCSYREKMVEVSDEIEDIGRFFREYAENIEYDPALLSELEERLAYIERIKKKYGPRIADVFAYRDSIKSKLEDTEHSEEELAELRSKLKLVKSRLFDSASELSHKRHEVAPHLEKEVESHLAELGMHGARLIIDIQRCKSQEKIEVNDCPVPVTRKGFDQVEFLISSNPGEPPRPLAKIASGGEISRIMLSLKLVLMDANSVPTMVFDEIDVGVSGRIAESIGRKLVKLTENRQALVITHLPQIAVMAHRHFSARKTLHDARTRSGLVLLDETMRQRELASLLSGEVLTDSALAHAKELMDSMKKSPN